MVTMSMRQWSPSVLGRLPVYGQQGAQVVLIGHARQVGEDILQVCQRIFAVALARHDQRVEDGRALARIGVPDEQPVFLSES